MIRKTILLALVSCGVTGIFMYPAVLKLSSVIPAFYSTDEPYGVIWSFWWFKYSWLNGIPAEEVGVLAYPHGMKISFFPLWGHIAKLLSVCSSEIIAYNLILLSSFVLSAVTMFLLVFTLTGNTWAGLFSALVYAFCPFHSVRAWQHFGTAQIQWMPLYLFFLFRLWQLKDWRHALFLGVSLALNYYYDVHYAYFMGLVTVLFLSLCLLSKVEIRQKAAFVRTLCAAWVLGIILVLPALLPFVSRIIEAVQSARSPHAYSLAKRAFDDLFSQSARPLSYLLPFTEQPIFGGVTRIFIGSGLWGESLTEHNIFLGFVALGLAFFSLYRKKEVIAYYQGKGIDLRFTMNFFFLLCVVCWLFSQPPWWNIFGFKFYLPSFFLYKVFPMVRAYVRFAVVVMLGVSVLAGIALAPLLNRFSGAARRGAVALLIILAALFEFWYIPSEHAVDLSRYPAVYDWLKDQPSGIAIAEYPLDIEGPNELYKFYQTKHHKPIINGAFPGTPAHEAIKRLQKLSQPATITALRSLGVDYVFLHLDDYQKTGLAEEAEEVRSVQNNSALKRVYADAGIEVYAISGNEHAGKESLLR